MAAGDPPSPWGLTEQCTCPTVWMGINPPPLCGVCQARAQPEVPFTPWPTPSNTTQGAPFLGVSTIATFPPAPPTVDAAMQTLAERVGVRIGAMGIDKANAAAFDAWQLVLAQLQVLREAVERAVDTEAAT